MNSTTLQIPINKNVRDQAAIVAEKMGFSSLQEVVRLFLKKVAVGEIDITFTPTATLSPKNERRYGKMIEEIHSGKVKTECFSDASTLMKYLHGEH